MFTEINDDTFATSIASGHCLVLFYKDQCPFCKAMKKIIAKFAEKPGVGDKGINFLQINRETSPVTTEAMDVTRIPAILVFKDGVKVQSKSGDVTYKDLERMIA